MRAAAVVVPCAAPTAFGSTPASDPDIAYQPAAVVSSVQPAITISSTDLVRPFCRIGLQRLLEDAGFTDIRMEGYTPPLRAWQRPVGAIASRIFPFLWRAVAANGGPHAL